MYIKKKEVKIPTPKGEVIVLERKLLVLSFIKIILDKKFWLVFNLFHSLKTCLTVQ